MTSIPDCTTLPDRAAALLRIALLAQPADETNRDVAAATCLLFAAGLACVRYGADPEKVIADVMPAVLEKIAQLDKFSEALTSCEPGHA